ncbi:MAG TPA: hypothetical protein VHX52_00485 [Steroidobacteraceae bacterium]|jgi:hypothetical protein|nr:hypothetical protein [Steroidobacteraceae bacterium]
MRVTSIAIALFSCTLCVQAATAPAADQAAGGNHGLRLDHGMLEGTWTRARDPAGFARVNAVLAMLHIQDNSFNQTRASRLIIVDTPPPLKPRYLQKWEEFVKASHEADLRGQPLATGYSHCLPDGMPSMMMGMFPMEVLQAPGDITVVEEAFRQIRHIYLDQQQITPITDAEPDFWGHSVGHWDGDTLMVNTIGIKDYVRLEDVPHSDQMQINEQIKLLSPDKFQDAITVIDPVYLTQPWSFTWTYQRDPGYKILEYVCEDNREDSASDQQRLKLFQDPAAQR